MVLLIGSILFGIGLILGLVPMSQGGANCGSAYIPASYWLSSPACDDATSSRRGIALALTIPGAILLTAGGIMKLAKSEAIA